VPDLSRYLQIAETLGARIRAQGPDSVLPAEHELARRFAVSRVTIRRALGVLERAGLVSRQRGRGTIVNPSKITRHLSPMRLFEEDLRVQGVAFETRLLDFQKECDVTPQVRERLALGPDEPVGFISLLRLVEGRVICHDRRYHAARMAEALDPAPADARTFPERLRSGRGRAIQRATWDTEIIPAPHDVATALGVRPSTLVVANSGIEYLESGVPLEAVEMYYRIDRVRFRFTSVTPVASPEGPQAAPA
jgi:GntR family transcriptional regulator